MPASSSPPNAVVTSRLVLRAGWGADESLRFDAAGAERWPRAETIVRRIVLHHTLSPNGEPDALARVRAIYAFHAVARGWGDMGYHLLIDAAGTVYEGRAGSARAFDGGPVAVGAHVRGHNGGALGIGLIGTFTDRPPAPRMRVALVSVLRRLSAALGIDPLGTVEEGTVPAICAHRDLAPTSCPGDACYTALAGLRRAVAAELRAPVGVAS
jgi:hypothetical protein